MNRKEAKVAMAPDLPPCPDAIGNRRASIELGHDKESNAAYNGKDDDQCERQRG
jgi:hypothetical protein